MDIHVYVLCHNVYGTFHKKGLGNTDFLQIQNITMNVNGKQSIRIYLSYDDFILDVSDWELLRNEIDNNIEYWKDISISYTYLNNTEFDCQSTSLNERKYRTVPYSFTCT